MNNIPQNTQDLTKFLRSKDITTEEICNVVSSFDDLSFNFPLKEVFVIELLVDRWNDMNITNFKTDPNIWNIFNLMYLRIKEGYIIDCNINSLFKHFKYVKHLIRTLELFNDSDDNIQSITKFLINFQKTCTLINQDLILNVTLSESQSIISNILNIFNKLTPEQLPLQTKNDIFNQLFKLTDLHNKSLSINFSIKDSNNYMDTTFLPSIEFITLHPNDTFIIDILSEIMKIFIFSPLKVNDSIDLLQKNIEKFSNSKKLNSNMCVIIFEKSLEFLSKKNITQLESLFITITKKFPQVSPILLKDISSSKKTLSQNFLEELFKNTISLDSFTVNNPNFWGLLLSILELDIEIGIKYFQELITLILKNFNEYPTFTKDIWNKVIQCHIDAREFYQFFEKLQIFIEKYDKIESQSSIVLIENPIFYNSISDNLPYLSSSQLIDILSNLIETILDDSTDSIIPQLILNVCCSGLLKMSYTVLPQLKNTFSKIFETDKNIMTLWGIKYILMEVYDDLVPDEYISSLKENGISIPVNIKDNFILDFTSYHFKLREYVGFDLNNVISNFINYYKNKLINNEDKLNVLEMLFTKWSSIINNLFNKSDIDFFINELFKSEEHLNLIEKLFEDDDFFEEDNITYSLTKLMSEHLDKEKCITLFTKLPIQCINKDIRLSLIDNVSKKSTISEIDDKLFLHLLQHPTFKSLLETDFKVLFEYLSKVNKYKHHNDIFQTIWSNHFSQLKVVANKEYIDNTISILLKNINKKSVDFISFQMAFYILMSQEKNEILQPLQEAYLKRVIEILKSKSITKINTKELTWYLKSLYYLSKTNSTLTDMKINELIPNIISEIQTNLHSMDGDLITSTFLLYCTKSHQNLEFLYAHYLALSNTKADSQLLLEGLDLAINNSLIEGQENFNKSFALSISAFSNGDSIYNKHLLNLFFMQYKKLTKDNELGSQIFRNSLVQISNKLSSINLKEILSFLKLLKELLITKAWLFSQYSIESLFALTLNIIHSNQNSEVFLACNSIVATILFVHRQKLTNRNHLVIGWLCNTLNIVSSISMDEDVAKALSRTIVSFCEGSSFTSANRSKQDNKLTSAVSSMKKTLRKDLPILLVTYIHLSLTTSMSQNIRKGLLLGIYSIFDVLSQTELELTSAMLNNSGRQYFKNLYTGYKKDGKWRED